MNRRDVVKSAAAIAIVAALPCSAETWHVYRLTDYEWYMGRTLEEAEAAMFSAWCTDRAGAIRENGYDPDEAYELDAEGMERHRMVESDEWEQPSGEPFSFRVALEHRIAEGPRAELFACTDW